jgi:hypothetical protein
LREVLVDLAVAVVVESVTDLGGRCVRHAFVFLAVDAP